MSSEAKRTGAPDMQKAERAIVIQLLRDDRAERWRIGALAGELADFEPVLFDGALARLREMCVLRHSETHVWASPAARHLDELGLIGI